MMISHEKVVVTVGVKKRDYTKQFNKKGLVLKTDAVVQYDEKHGAVLVDKRATDDDYLKWAAINEVACSSRSEEFCGSKVPKWNDPTRRKAIEKIMVTSVLPQEDREVYVRKRLEAYLALMDFYRKNKFVMPSLVEAYAYLQLWSVNHLGKRHV